MPLLVVFGVPVKTAVGIALFNSIFIAVPSSIGYAMGCRPGDLLLLLPLSLCKPRDWRLDWKQKYLPDSSGCAEKRCSCISVLLAILKFDYRVSGIHGSGSGRRGSPEALEERSLPEYKNV